MVYIEELKKVRAEVIDLATNLLDANKIILDGFTTSNKELFQEARKAIKNISSKINDIDNSIIKILALYSPEAKDLREVVGYLKITNEILRASSSTRSFAKGINNIYESLEKNIIEDYIIPMQKSTIKALNNIISMIEIDCEDDLKDTLNEVLVQESKTDDYYEMIEKRFISDATKIEDFEKFHTILQTIRKGAKIADRTSSMANIILYIKLGGRF